MERLLLFDRYLFYLINSRWTHPLLDTFFPFWTDFQKINFFKFFVFPLVLFLIFKKWRGIGISIVIMGLVFTNIFDVVINFTKSFFLRPRPVNSNLPFEVIIRGPGAGGYSFPSGHSADAFFLAVYLSFFFPQGRLIFYVMAFFTAYSRIYCGIHYPLDVIGGAIAGTVCGYLTAVLSKRFFLAVTKKKRRLFWNS